MVYELVHMHGAETLADGRFLQDCAMLGCFFVGGARWQQQSKISQHSVL